VFGLADCELLTADFECLLLVLCLAADCWLLVVGRLLFVVDRVDTVESGVSRAGPGSLARGPTSSIKLNLFPLQPAVPARISLGVLSVVFSVTEVPRNLLAKKKGLEWDAETSLTGRDVPLAAAFSPPLFNTSGKYSDARDPQLSSPESPLLSGPVQSPRDS
jgi:hypothetical protein